MIKDEALKLALEALEYMGMTAERYVDNRIPEVAIAAIKEALAQEQTPVHDHLKSQRTWVGLTDEEIELAMAEPTLRKIYHAIEAKLKEKNT